MQKKNRQAVVIGINNYKDQDIPKLSGAVNDATEMYKRLKDYGEFEIPEEHFLINDNADCKSIRKAISDLLWQTDECELALLFFSGHGFQDGYGNGYIAPHDMLKDQPFVSGINMQELKEIVLSSPNKQCVLVVLDCCYSGIPTKGDKAVAEVTTSFDTYFSELNAGAAGEGKIIFASSGEDQKSREIFFDKGEQKNFCHGIFTYHLLHGIEGEASDQTGTITLDRLRNYVEKQFDEKKQRPKFYAANSSQLDQIKIAIASEIFENFISVALNEAGELIKQDDDNNSNLIDPSSLIVAAEKVNQVLEKNSTNAAAVDLKNNINSVLLSYRDAVEGWIFENKLEIKPKIVRVFTELEKLVASLNFQMIIKLDNSAKTKLSDLCEVSTGNIDKARFLEKCRAYDNPRPKTNSLSNSISFNNH